MSKHPSRRGYFFTALAGSLIGLLAGVLLVSVVPAVAANGDNLVLGASNRAGRSTWLASRGPSVLKLNNTAGATVLNLRNGGGAAPLAVDSDVMVENLNAELLGGLEVDHLVRVGYDSTDDAADTDGPAATVTMGVPQPGLLVMSGTIDAGGGNYDWYGCRLKVDDTVVAGTHMRSTVNDGGGDHTSNDSENCSTTGAQPVAAGSYEVTLDIAGRDLVTFDEASLWVLYVPFDHTGNPPTIP
jgi:hypothetical protein